MQSPDQPIHRLKISPVGVRAAEKVQIALYNKLLRKGSPDAGAERGDRGGGEQGGGHRGARNGPPSTGSGEGDGKQDPELRLIGKPADEYSGQHRPAL